MRLNLHRWRIENDWVRFLVCWSLLSVLRLTNVAVADEPATTAKNATNVGINWFAAPTAGDIEGKVVGAADGDGSSERPWEIQFALDGAGGKIKPGDTLWLRGGVYKSAKAPTAINAHLIGQKDRPIIVRNYRNERAVFDGVGTGWALFVSSDYAWYGGLEFTDSSPIAR